jgi:hypothetical protein
VDVILVEILAVDPVLDILSLLARPELDNAEVGQPPGAERVLPDDRDLLPALADCEDHSAVTRDLSSRHQEVAGGIVLLQEADMGGNARVDFSETRFVDK